VAVGGRVYEVACWTHARRKCDGIHAIHALAHTAGALARAAALHAIEDELRAKSPGLRREVRQSRARPLIQETAQPSQPMPAFEAKSETGQHLLAPKAFMRPGSCAPIMNSD